MNSKIINRSILCIYTYGGLRSLYYNQHIYDRNEKKPLLGYKFANTLYSIFLSIPMFPLYLFDDLNTFDAHTSKMKYEKSIMPFDLGYTFKINFEKEIK